jgi:hypothetical protein
VGTLWRAILEGFGWHVGREAAKEAIEEASRALQPEPEAAPADARAIETERKARAKADERAARERASAKKREEKAIDAELRALKKRIGR